VLPLPAIVCLFLQSGGFLLILLPSGFLQQHLLTLLLHFTYQFLTVLNLVEERDALDVKFFAGFPLLSGFLGLIVCHLLFEFGPVDPIEVLGMELSLRVEDG
jgi:hypothetical protein